MSVNPSQFNEVEVAQAATGDKQNPSMAPDPVSDLILCPEPNPLVASPCGKPSKLRRRNRQLGVPLWKREIFQSVEPLIYQR